MKLKNNTPAFILFLLAALAFSGCQSMQKDLLLPGLDDRAFSGLTEIEEAVVRLDGGGADKEGLAKARRQIAAMEGSVADPDFQAQLAAWSGRLYLMEGKNSDAQREYRKAQNLSARNLQSRILSFRLERDLSKRLSLISGDIESSGQPGELLIERGRALFDLNRFFEAVAAFDSAFALLAEKPFYEEAYRIFRGKAWELRELEQGTVNRTMEIARQEEITWKDLIEMTKNETNLIRFITAGRDWPAETIFAQLLERSVIPLSQNAALSEWPSSKPSSAETVLRSGAAWFLWHINAENRANRGLLTRYSSRLQGRSPIPDLDPRSPFIDSVLGCVESEFMSLPDGRNFLPHDRVKGSDFLSMLKKIGP